MKPNTTTRDYRACFNTEAGRRTLASMLLEAKFFDHEHTPEEQAVSNFMKTVLCKCGTYVPQNLDSYVDKVLSMKVHEHKE